jgi:hypothetical protein
MEAPTTPDEADRPDDPRAARSLDFSPGTAPSPGEFRPGAAQSLGSPNTSDRRPHCASPMAPCSEEGPCPVLGGWESTSMVLGVGPMVPSETLASQSSSMVQGEAQILK